MKRVKDPDDDDVGFGDLKKAAKATTPFESEGDLKKAAKNKDDDVGFGGLKNAAKGQREHSERSEPAKAAFTCHCCLRIIVDGAAPLFCVTCNERHCEACCEAGYETASCYFICPWCMVLFHD